MKNLPKVKRRIAKLLELAERGEGGEKANAQRMLEKTLEAHGLTLDDIATDERTLVWFRYEVGPHRKELLIQLAAKICGKDVSLFLNKSKQRQVGIECSEYEKLQLEMSHKIYQRAFKREVELAYSAFLNVNQLYATDYTDEELNSQRSEYTEAELQDQRDALARANQMDVTQVNPALTENKVD